MRVGDNVLTEVQVLLEVLDSGVREPPVVVLPRECLLDKAAASQRLHHLHHLDVRELSAGVFLKEGVLLGGHYAILEQLSVQQLAVLLGNEHSFLVGRGTCPRTF